MHLDEQGNYATRQLPDGSIAFVMQMTYGKGRINIMSQPPFINASY